VKYIYHHLGLGDHIICNGLVRYYRKIHQDVSVFCKPHNFNNVEYMFRDDSNINVLSIGEDYDVHQYIIKNKIQNDVITVGFEKLNITQTNTFDESFYVANRIPFEVRFDYFHVDRDMEIELKIIQKLNPSNEKYIFTHNVNLEKINTNYKIIENPTEYNLFNLISLIENAEEVHLMESSLKCLINSYKFKKPIFYYHEYVRNYTPYYNTLGLNKFQIIK